MNQNDSIEANDFAFYFGDWKVQHRKLLKRLQGCTDWEIFEGTATCFPMLGGIGNVDELHMTSKGVIGMSVRLFNIATQEWSIYWASNQDGILQPPVIGSFKDGTGIFYGQDEFDGSPILVRFIWSNTNTPNPRWEQAFSTDDGATWETNWYMDFTRA